MSATTEDRTERESPVDAMLEDVPFSDLEAPPSKLAAETPLTREAVIHVRAAAGEVSQAYGDVHALLDTVERALSEPVGGEKVLSEEGRLNLARLVHQARQKADHEMQRPVFERGRGERPHGGVMEQSVAPLLSDLLDTLWRGASATAAFTGIELERQDNLAAMQDAANAICGELNDAADRIAELLGRDADGWKDHNDDWWELVAELEDDDSEEGEGRE